MSRDAIMRASLVGLALLLFGCGAEPAVPAPSTPDEQAAIAKAEAMIDEGRPGSDPDAAESRQE